MMATIHVCDFAHSFIRWRIDTLEKPVVTVSRPLPMTLNAVRVPLDCRTVITHEATGMVQEIALGVSCKTEQVWVDQDVWHHPNADMLMWATRDEFVIFKRWDRMDKGVMLHPPSLGPQPERQLGKTRDAFARFALDMKSQPGETLDDSQAIIAALAGDRTVIAQTTFRAHGYHVLMEYPVKTVNYSEREHYYQVDTGPVLLPDVTAPATDMLLRCRVAFIAHNASTWAECLACVPTEIADGLRVQHYAESIRLEDTVNRMIAV